MSGAKSCRQPDVANSGYSLDELAEHLELPLRVQGQPSRHLRIDSAAGLEKARPGQISFLANTRYRRLLQGTQASVVILSETMSEHAPCASLVSENPYASWAQALNLLNPAPSFKQGVADSADVHPTAQVDASARIEGLCLIGADVRIGPRCRIGPGCVIESGSCIEADSELVGQVYIGSRVKLGQRVRIHPGVVIGSDGFGIAMDSGQWQNVPQLGSVVIGDDCEIGANTTIDRGALDDTILGNDVRIDNQVQIAHNVVIGDHTAIAGCVGIAGSTRIGQYCLVAGASGIAGHLDICDHVVITAMSTVLHSIDQPGSYGSGIPARPQRSWQRLLVRLGQLDRWMRRSRE